ncbi:deoxyuridine 5'-triphosphate nucleotidohydrolase [Devosia lucknowensis]|uniref:Deoxyuridine 5'-triphosphate nucleotidohydrolase n=1 Tax=Devosia lucknowensis TaxID=1096929 RepID=A0A1Y6G6M4_9HYPH|nr:dUTP diphosphatase [Devosia lucknowensis]SMQ85746.1 deoxyuridine 5'-triphosphate nucleotidohydrolase [Devosia lucknowensis]
MTVRIAVKWLEHGLGLPLPRQQTSGAAGLDLAAAIDADDPLTIAPGDFAMVPTGLAIALPEGYEAQIRPRSGLAAKYGVTVLNSPGTVDADYRGEVQILLINHGKMPFVLRRGDRVAQMVVAPVSAVEMVEVHELDTTERGGGGHGSTGR